MESRQHGHQGIYLDGPLTYEYRFYARQYDVQDIFYTIGADNARSDLHEWIGIFGLRFLCNGELVEHQMNGRRRTSLTYYSGRTLLRWLYGI